jgi:hypothetical protein
MELDSERRSSYSGHIDRGIVMQKWPPRSSKLIGGFSSAVHLLDPATQLAGVDAAKLRLLWIACGVDDNLVSANRKLIAYLKDMGLTVTAVETPGAHHFNVWRDNLVQFAPLLFR